MSTFTWAAAVSGNWTTTSNWSPAQVPGSADTALIDLTGSFVVSVDTATVGSITLDDPGGEISASGLLTVNDALAITAGTLLVSSPTGSVIASSLTNSGTILDDGSLLAGGLSNSGTIILDNGSLTLSGGYDAAGLSLIGGTAGTLSLGGSLSLAGAAIDATGWSDLTIASLGTLQGGTIIATAEAGTATLDGMTWQGTLIANDGPVVIENGLAITGAGGSGPGEIDVDGVLVEFKGDQTLQHARVFPTAGTIAVDNDLMILSSVELQPTASGAGGSLLQGAGTVTSDGLVDVNGETAGEGVFANMLTISVADFENSGVFETTGGPGPDIASFIGVTSTSFDNLAGGSMTAIGGEISIAATTNFSNSGSISADGGTIDFAGGIDTLGDVTLLAGGTMEFGGAAGSGTIGFDDGGGDLLLFDQPTLVSSEVNGFVSGDTITLGVSATAVSYGPGDLKMRLGDGQTFDLDITGKSSLANFQINTGSDSTTITTCFAAGSRLATLDGDIAVEALRVGDHMLLADGGMAPVRWIGHRHVDCLRHPRPSSVWPVRVAADAFGGGRPRRDLLLSPDHAVFVEGVLIPVKYLINDDTIARRRVASILYYHVELPTHGVLLAEGLPVESYLDVGDRTSFSNGGQAIALFANFTAYAREGGGFAQYVVTGRRLEAVRARLNAAAAVRAPQAVSDLSSYRYFHGLANCDNRQA